MKNSNSKYDRMIFVPSRSTMDFLVNINKTVGVDFAGGNDKLFYRLFHSVSQTEGLHF